MNLNHYLKPLVLAINMSKEKHLIKYVLEGSSNNKYLEIYNNSSIIPLYDERASKVNGLYDFSPSSKRKFGRNYNPTKNVHMMVH
jgi:hypothetical protein